MSRLFVALFPIVGALVFPIIVPIIISYYGISYGVMSALLLSTVWFVIMLRTAEMPH